MNSNLYAFILSTLAGLSTLIGFLFLNIKWNRNSMIIFSLSFAAGVMCSVSLVELFPESLTILTDNFPIFPAIILCLIFINIGFIVSGFINKKIVTEDSLYKVGLVSMVAIALHNIPEGIATFLTAGTNSTLGISLAISIALHNIPEGISIALPIYYATKNKKKAFIYTLIAGFSEPLGAILAFYFFKSWITDIHMGFLYAFIAGIMIHISLTKLFPEAFLYNEKRKSILFFIIGFIFMLLMHLFF